MGLDSCPECGSDDYEKTGNRESEDNNLVNLQCRVCGQNYDLAESYVSA